MTSRIKSALLRRTNSIKRPTLTGIKDTLRSARPAIGNDTSYESNEYIHQSFYESDNYQSLMKCLDDGYKVSMNLIEYMQDYCVLQQEHAQNLTTYSKKWVTKLKQQPSLSSYNTTKRAQIQTINSPDKLAQLIQPRCEAIQQVITTYRRQVERMYPSERLGTVHKHYRTESLRKAFKTAYTPFSKVSDALKKLREQEEEAETALHDADIQCENLSLDPTATKKQINRAKDHQQTKQYEVQDIQEKIARTEDEYKKEQDTYYQKATVIYNEYREYEKERLDQIRDTLLEFSQAAHTSDYSAGQDKIFETLIEHIKTQQDSLKDLDFWAETYHINVSAKSVSSELNHDDHDNTDSQTTTTTTQKSKKSQKTEAETVVPSKETTNQPVLDDEEEQSTTNIAAAKAKQKKSKNSTSTEKKSNSTTEPTTPTTTKLS